MLYICEGGGLGITRTHLKLVLSSRQRTGLSGGLFGHSPPYISKPASAFRLLQGPGIGWPEEGTRDGARDLQQMWCAANLSLLRSSKTSLPSPRGHMLDVMVWGTEKDEEPSSSTRGVQLNTHLLLTLLKEQHNRLEGDHRAPHSPFANTISLQFAQMHKEGDLWHPQICHLAQSRGQHLRSQHPCFLLNPDFSKSSAWTPCGPPVPHPAPH